MSDEVTLEQNHLLYRQEEITQLLVNDHLRRQGIDPAQCETTSKQIYRVIDGKLVGSIFIEKVVRHPPEGAKAP